VFFVQDFDKKVKRRLANFSAIALTEDVLHGIQCIRVIFLSLSRELVGAINLLSLLGELAV